MRRKEFFRFNDRTGEWKKLVFEFVEDGSVFVSLEQGKKGENGSVRLTVKLEQSEVALLQVFLFRGLVFYL
ncbi:MAG: hypothetical protein ACP5P0_06690 [Hydrogenobacter sp.]|jgi:hypothetical protein